MPGVLATRWAAIPTPVRAALLMVSCALCWACMPVAIRFASTDIDPIQIAFLRNLFGLMLILPMVARTGMRDVLRTRNLGMFTLRAVLNTASMLLWFSAVAIAPIADVTAIGFTQPLWSTIGSALILGEVVRARRWVAIGLGFLGVVVVIQPGFQEVNLGAIFILGSAFLFAGVNLIVKRLSAREKPEVIVFYMGALMTPLSLGPALLVWVNPSWEALGWCVLIAAFANLGHLFHTRAFSLADASAVLPFDFARLPFVAFLGYVFFAEAPTAGTWLGGLLIFGSTVYIAHREARAARDERLEQAAQADAARLRLPSQDVPAGDRPSGDTPSRDTPSGNASDAADRKGMRIDG